MSCVAVCCTPCERGGVRTVPLCSCASPISAWERERERYCLVLLFTARDGLCGKVKPPHLTYLPPTSHRSKPSAPAQRLAAPVRRAEAAPRPAPCTRPAAGPPRPTTDRPAAPAQAYHRRRSKSDAGCGLLPCPVTRRALARPPHRARSARLLAAAAARPAPPRLPPLLTRTPRRRRSGTDGAATAPAVAAPPLRRARRARTAAAAAAAAAAPSFPQCVS